MQKSAARFRTSLIRHGLQAPRRFSVFITAFMLVTTLASLLSPSSGAAALHLFSDSTGTLYSPPFTAGSLRPLFTATPAVSLGVPDNVFIGEPFSFTATFDNSSVTDTDVGYGPYVDIYLPIAGADGAGAEIDDGISFSNASYLGIPLTPIAPSPFICAGGTYTHPLTNLATSCVNETQVVILQLPFGSFVPDQPPAVVTINAETSNLADLDTALTIRASSGFMYGADPLDNPGDDPILIGGTIADTITPVLLTLEKTFSGEENETATGPSWLQTYTITVDIADGQELTAIDLTDLLPNSVAFHAVVSTTPAATSTTTPPVDVPFDPDTDSLIFEFDSATGSTGASDIEVEFSFFVPEFDSEDNSILDPDEGGCVQITNDAALGADWIPIDGRDYNGTDPIEIESDDTADDQTFDACAMVIRKDLNIETDILPNGASPQDTLEYVYRIDVSDYFTLGGGVDDGAGGLDFSDTWEMDDVMSDGQLFLFGDIAPGVDATYAFTDRAGSSSGTFAHGGNLTVDMSANPDYGTGGTCGAGTTSLHFDLAQQVVDDDSPSGDHPDAILVGGCVGSSGDPSNPCGYPAPESAATARIEYRAQIQEEYSCTVPSGDQSLDQNDSISNHVDAAANVLDNDTQVIAGGPTLEDSNAGAVLDVGTLTKVIYARNGVVLTGPGTPQFAPGDTITYRLTYTTPTSDIEDFALIDFLPLPVLQVDDFDADNVYGDAASWVFNYVTAGPTDTPAVGEAMWGPADTFHLLTGGNPDPPPAPTLSADIPANSLTFNLGDYDNDSNPTSTIDILFTITVQDDPFADGLFLTNQVRSTKNNSFLETNVQDDIIQFELTEPVLGIIKGVVDASNPDGIFSLIPPLPAGVDFTQGSCPSLTSGTVTSDGLAANPIDSDLSAVDAGDVVTYAIVVENTGSGLYGVFDLVVQDTLPAEIDPATDVSNICVMDGTGAAITTSPVGGGIGLFDQGIVLEDPGPVEPQDGVLEPYNATSGRNIAVITYDVTLPDDIEPEVLLTNTASVENYASVEGGANFIDTFGPLEDDANVTIRIPGVDKDITATNQTFTAPEASPWPAAIGEIIDYEVVITVPEGVSSNVTLVDTLDPGLAFVSLEDLVVNDYASLTTDVPDTSGDGDGFDEIFAAGVISAIGAGAENAGRRVTFDFGTLTNTDRNNDVDETITLTYRVVVLNTEDNNRDVTLSNNVVWTWDEGDESGSAPTAIVVEPTLQVNKLISTNTGDAGDTRTYSITISHATGSNATAFDIELEDIIPVGVTYAGNLVCNAGSVTPDACSYAVGTLTASWTSAGGLAVGQNSIISFDVTIDSSVYAGQVITNTASIEWTSLPDPDGNSAQSTENTLSVERTGNPADVGGAANDYNASDPAILTIEGGPVKTIIATSESHTDDSSGTEYLAIGEIVRYHLAFQLPESTSTNLQFQDVLPAGLQFIDDGTAMVGFVANDAGISSSTLTAAGLGCTGDGLPGGAPDLNWSDDDGTIVPECPLPDAAVSSTASGDNDTYNDGTDIYFNFGTVINGDRDSDLEYVIVAFNAVALNVAGNQAEDTTPNHGNRFNVRVSGTTVDTSNTVNVRIAEPVVELTKAVATAPLDAGDTAIYRFVFTNTASGDNAAAAFNLTLADTLNAAYLTLTNVEIDPLTTPPAYATVDIDTDFSGNVVAVAVNELRPGDAITILVTAEVKDDVPAGLTIQNTGTLNYASLPEGTGTDPNPTGSTTPGDQSDGDGARDGSGGVNDYNDQALAEIELTDPAIGKFVSPSTYTIGEEIVFDLVVTLPEGVTHDLVVVDDIPAYLSAISYEIIEDEASSGGRLAEDFLGSLPAPAVSIPGGSGVDVIFNFGDTTTDVNETDDNAFLIRITAQVLNVLQNQRTQQRINAASLFYTDPEDGADTEVPSNTVTITLIEPELQVVKTASNSQPAFNETVTYTLIISHLGTSGSDAYEVALHDVIPTGLTYVGSSLNCTTGAQDPATCSIVGDTLSATWPVFLDNGTTSVITYQAVVGDVGEVSLDQDLTNNAAVTWTSLNGAPSEERTSGDGVLNDGSLNDYENPTSETVTVTGPDLAIDKDDGLTTVVPGQIVVYTLRIDNNGNGLASGITVTDDVPDHTTFNAGSSTVGWSCDDPDGGGPLGPGDPGSTCTIGLADLVGGVSTSVDFALTINTPLPTGVEQIENIAIVFDDGTHGPDPTPLDNTDNDIDDINAAPDLTIDKDDGIDIIAEGSTLNYTLTYQNVGDQDATGVNITDVVPANTTFNAAASTAGWSCDDPDGVGPINPGEPGSTCAFDIGALAAGSPAGTVLFVLNVDIPLPPSVTQIQNTAVIADDGANGSDPTPLNNTDDDIDNISAIFTKDIIATSQGHTSPEASPWTAAIGEIITYELQLIIPPGTKQNLIIVDVLEPGLAFVDCLEVSGTAGLSTSLGGGFDDACNDPVNPLVQAQPIGDADPLNEGRTITFNLGDVTQTPGSEGTLTIRYTVVVLNNAGNNRGDQLRNSAVASWTGSRDLGAGAPEATLVEPDLTVDKTTTANSVLPNDIIPFTITIEHSGASNADAFDLLLTDVLPPELTFQTGSVVVTGLTPTSTDFTDPANLEFRWDSFPQGSISVIEFDVQVGSLGPGDGATNRVRLEWTSLPDDGVLAARSLSSYNEFATERYYDPGSAVNVYGAADSLTVYVPELPETGFAPGVVSELPPAQPYQDMEGMRLIIPALGLDLPIVGVPTGDDGWDLTWLWNQAGYLAGTAYPTWPGNTALTAHVTLPDGTPGPFVDLANLRWGDEIIIESGWQHYIYRVSTQWHVSPRDLSVLGHSDYDALTLITCEGYDVVREIYRGRVAVRAVLMSVEDR
ncbi:MAG: DUF11 domain-containing protein [Anaerolineales bacterium]|nr:DUF11 domain-containing protein [Anaerolineales bacterium]